jgi:uncharacterized membrane-anchored protein YitT (DUF2179 family)
MKRSGTRNQQLKRLVFPHKTFRGLQVLFMLTLGSVLQALAAILFLAPSEIAPGGISGMAIILNGVIHTPVGLVTLIGNIPIQIFAYRLLGGGRVVISTIYAVLVFAVSADILTPILEKQALSDDALLNALFGGILGGIGVGLVHRVGGTAGGTSTLGRILQYRFGIPISSAYLYTDTGVILAAGLAFGAEAAMLSFVSLFISGMASDYVLEGPSVIRTVTIITDYPQEVSQALILNLGRGVTAWEGTGMYTHQARHILYIVVTRAQVTEVQQIVHGVDSSAFVVVGQGHIAYGHGFKEVRA